MRPVLVLEHQAAEQVAYLGTYLRNRSIPVEIVNATQREFPTSMEPYSALAVMGGGMSANDPLLSNRQAEILILQSMLVNKPVIGHCLGGQLMARALGAQVRKSPRPEIGWQPIKWADSPEVARWFGVKPTDTVIHWHYDSFDIPAGATLLASTDACPNQAFAYGPHLAMQFHIEMDTKKAHWWTEDPDPEWDAAKQYASVQDRDTIRNGLDQFLDSHQRTADAVYNRWLSTAKFD